MLGRPPQAAAIFCGRLQRMQEGADGLPEYETRATYRTHVVNGRTHPLPPASAVVSEYETRATYRTHIVNGRTHPFLPASAVGIRCSFP